MAQREFLFHILFHSQDVAIKLPQYAKPVVAWHKRASAGCPHLEETWFLFSYREVDAEPSFPPFVLTTRSRCCSSCDSKKWPGLQRLDVEKG